MQLSTYFCCGLGNVGNTHIHSEFDITSFEPNLFSPEQSINIERISSSSECKHQILTNLLTVEIPTPIIDQKPGPRRSLCQNVKGAGRLGPLIDGGRRYDE